MPVTYSKLGQNGRLGNAMFECAAAIALAKRYDDSYFFPNWIYEKEFPNLKNCFVKNLPKIDKIYTEPFFHYQEIPYSPNIDLSGYFQSFKYFNDFRGLINQLFNFDKKINPLTGYTAIHVRRGDYVSLGEDFYINLEKTNYYKKAIEIINSPKYLVISDDIYFCKKYFTGNNFEFSNATSPIEDMNLMTVCENVIMANSSFSFWGAFLNKNVDKVVIAPQQWFGKKLPHNTKDIVPTDWKRI